jgi:hypothetical protein
MGETLATASAKAGMGQKIARKWRQSGQLQSEPKELRNYRTRPDAFANVWLEVEKPLDRDVVIEAETIFGHLCRQHPGKFGRLLTNCVRAGGKSKCGRRSRGSREKFSFPQAARLAISRKVIPRI